MNQSLFSLICIFTLFFCIPSTHAEVFKWVDANGQIHYSDKKPEQQKTETIKIKSHYQTPVTEVNVNQAVDLNDRIQTEKTAKTTYKKKHTVTMYAASWCSICKQARAYFKKNNIRYTEYDIEKNVNAQKRYAKLGSVGVPLMVANQKQMQGFSVAQFERWYGSL
jgi:glutaredoxin